MNIQFQYKELIVLLAAIPLFITLFILLLRWKKRTAFKMGKPELIQLLTRNFSPALFTTRFILLSLGFAIGVIALMNPRKPGDTDNVTRRGIDVIIALDVSKSMLATDLAPSRLERAKQFINKLISSMPDDRIGLVLFAGNAYLQMPLTIDHGAAQLFVNAANPDAVPQQGTLIHEALNMSLKAFNANDRRFKSIILLSDGEEHDAQAIATAEQLSQQGVMINTVGIGSSDGATIPDPVTGQSKTDGSGNTVITRLNDEVLKQIASKTNGTYIHLQGSDEAVNAMKTQFSQIDRKSFTDISLANYKTYYWWFAAGMLLLILTESFIPERKKRSV